MNDKIKGIIQIDEHNRDNFSHIGLTILSRIISERDLKFHFLINSTQNDKE